MTDITPQQARGRIVSACARIVGWWDDMTAPTSGTPGARTGGAILDDNAASDADMDRTHRALQARLDVETALVPYCQEITDARAAAGMECGDRPAKAHGPTMAAYISTHIDHLIEATPPQEIENLVGDIEGQARTVERHALPDKPHTIQLGHCTAPDLTGTGECGGTVRTHPDDPDHARCQECHAAGSIEDWRRWIAPELPLMTGPQVCKWLHDWHGITVSPVTLRTRKNRGRLKPERVNEFGHDLFDPIAVWHHFRDTPRAKIA